jgi:hypothetical protein
MMWCNPDDFDFSKSETSEVKDMHVDFAGEKVVSKILCDPMKEENGHWSGCQMSVIMLNTEAAPPTIGHIPCHS